MRPNVWFTIIGVLWSITCMLQAFAKNGTTFTILRALLGVFESGFSPGVIAYLNYWYTRTELGSRMLYFYMSFSIAGIIGSPLSAILASNKIFSFKPFQSIFFFEGLITLILCIIGYFVIQNSPEEAKFLTVEERELALRRLSNEQGISSKTKVNMKQIFGILMDWKLWIFCLILLGAGVGPVVGSIFGPSIITSLGFTGVQATYLAGLPSISGLAGLFAAVYLTNKVDYSIMLVFFGIVHILGYSVFVFTSGKVIRLIFSFISGFGSLPLIPVSITWCLINQGGMFKRMIASALIVSISSTSGIFLPRVFVYKYYPKFTIGHSLAIGIMSLALALTVFLNVYYRYENKRRDLANIDASHLPEQEQRDLFDKHPKFRYRL
ncbi:putative transporter [Smittium culicis]|uniref:Putative transporter n=1 Tax=Smittium culicis TaxID=133412 RepID=A0A1R1YQ52_9FUNG|nr:putative transporter [Smittium culicis]